MRGFSLDGQWLGDSSKILVDHERKNVLPLEALDINDAVPWQKMKWELLCFSYQSHGVNGVIGGTPSIIISVIMVTVMTVVMVVIMMSMMCLLIATRFQT